MEKEVAVSFFTVSSTMAGEGSSAFKILGRVGPMARMAIMMG